MSDTPPLSAVPDDEAPVDVQRQFAETVEKNFNAQGWTLTDDDTAAVYQITLNWIERALEGAQVQGILTEEQRVELARLIEGMRAAPRLV